jgi:hypothetical protein
MNLYDNLNVLTQGLIQVVIQNKAHEKDDYFMEIWDRDIELSEALADYFQMERYCLFLRRKNLFYRTLEELNDIFSDAFIEAFFRGNSYPIRSYKGVTIGSGAVRAVRLSKFVKDSLLSKIITINTEFHNKRVQEIAEHRITNKDGEDFGFEDFLNLNGVESLQVDLTESVDYDECDTLLLELSKEIYPQVSYVMLLKDFELTEVEFKDALQYQLNLKKNVPEYLADRYEKITEAVGKVIMNNKERIGHLFGGQTRLSMVSA